MGVGKKLLDCMEEELKQKGAIGIMAHLIEHNCSGIKFLKDAIGNMEALLSNIITLILFYMIHKYITKFYIMKMNLMKLSIED